MKKTTIYFSKIILLLAILCGASSAAWADTWDGNITNNANNKFAENGITLQTPGQPNSETNPYTIDNAKEFAYFMRIVHEKWTGYTSAYYWKLTADIDLNNIAWAHGSNTSNSFQGHFDGGGYTISNVKLDVTTNSNYGLFPTIQGASATNLAEVKNLNISGVTITTDANDRGSTTKIGSLTGYVKNATVTNITVSNVTITHNGNTTGNNYVGGLTGQVEGASGGQTKILNCSVESVSINLNGNISGTTHVGGAIGYLGWYTLVDGMTVKGTNAITGPTSDSKTVKNGVQFFVGGFLGYQHSSGTAAYQPNKFMNIAVSGMNINLGHYVPQNQIKDHKFAVGGIAGCVNAPNQDALGNRGMPENLIAKGVKIYAPWAATSPTVPNFNAGAPAHNNLTTEVVTTVDALEKNKTKTWYYSDYKLGLSQAFLDCTKVKANTAAPAKDEYRKNYTDEPAEEGGIKYLAISNTTFKKQNRYLDNDRDSWTVLWWTKDNAYSAAGPTATNFTATEQPIYPNQNANTTAGNLKDDYPYYMYFYQGVANATYVTDAVATKIIAGIAGNKTEVAKDHPITLTISNPNENERGFDQRTISVVAKTTDNEGNVVDATTGITGYQWYVNGEANGTGTSINLTPHWKDGTGITVNALNGETVVATASYTLAPGVLKTKAGSTEKIRSDINARGTKANPYIIDCENALRQISFLSTSHTGTRWEGIVVPVAPFPTNQPVGHYNRAYYELGADITMTAEAFTPISHMGYSSDATWGTYNQNFIFQGHFDGKGHKISGLKITWGAGQYNGNDANVYHGLFGAVGHTTATAKWGDGTTTSNTVIQNLVIENATLTHDPANTTFSYKKNYSHFPTNANENNCMVGVMAGVVAANTTVQNIEIRGSKITDDGSSDYSLATKGLFVGGAIGSVQAQYNTTNIPTNTVIKNIVVGTDIELTHAKVQDLAIAQQGAYNVGGIIGRFASTNGNLANTQAVMPKYLLYTGSIKAWSNTEGKKDGMISPVIAATRYSGNSGVSLTNISKIWEGNNNAAEQLTVADALYYNFQISDASGTMHLVTEDYPDKVCNNGARTQDTHTDGNETVAGYNAQRYQGVNYNAIFCDAATYDGDADGGKRMAIAILNSHNDVTVYWAWTPGDKTPHMVEAPSLGAYIVRDAETKDKYNVVGTATAGSKYYKWYVGDTEQSEHSSSITVPADISNFTLLAKVYENSSAPEPIATTQYLVIKGDFKVNTSISKDGDTYTVGLTRGDVDIIANPDPRLTITYQWYKGDAVNVNTATLISDETSYSIIQGDATLGDVYNLFCHVKIVLSSSPGTILYEGNINYDVNKNGTVIFLQLQDIVKDSKGITHNKPATSGTGTVENPVTSWANAYAKLKGYTEPTQAYVTGHGGTWTSTTNYNDEVYYLAHKDEYAYDTYKREGNKRKVKPIDECTNNWNNNKIVLMGLSTDGYFNSGETNQHTVDGARANKPVTITGQYNGVNYYGYLSNSSGDFSINADHKFENMGIGVRDKGIGAAESVRYRIYAHRWNVWAGNGLLMGWAAALEWGPEVVPVTDENKKNYKITSADVSTGTPVGQYACDIAIMGGYLNDNTSSNPEMFEYINHGRDDVGQQIKIESGFWGPVCPGNRQTGEAASTTTYYTMGGPDHPAKTTITVDIDRVWNDGNGGKRAQFNSAMSPATVDVGCLLTGNHEGTMYADVTLNILSANMGRMVNGIKGAQRRQVKNPASFTTNDVYRHTVKYGDTWTPIAAPAPDSYFGRGILNFDPGSSVNNTTTDTEVGINKRVSVIELYCGGLGRGHNDGSYHPEVRSYFYGLCEVNIKGGMFYKTIYGSGAGGTNGIGTATNHTDDDGIPYWNTEHETPDANGKTPHVWYAPYDYIKTKNNFDFVKVKVAKNNLEDQNLTDDGEVDLEKTRNIINITGGIFGSEDKPVSIYAGGNGETDAALVNPSGTTLGDVKNKYNTPNHQAGNMYGSKEGLTTEINISGDAKIYGSIYGGGKGSMRYYRYFLRAADADVAYTNDNQDYTRIWFPKRSSNGDYNTNGGLDWTNIINSRKNADRYLNLGQVYGNTKVSISGDVVIFGNVYGGGEGVSDITVGGLLSETDAEFGLNAASDAATVKGYNRTNHIGETDADWNSANFVNFPGMGKIFGNSGVEISGNVTIHGNVYGGGKAGAIDGTTNVDVKGDVNIFGKVYGAGEGLTVNNAKDYTKVATIKGDATVTLSENAYLWQDVFGGGQNAVVNGNTSFNMSGGYIAANVYGGGEGKIEGNNVTFASVLKDSDKESTAPGSTGNTFVNIEDGKVIWDRTSMAEATSSTITIHTYTKTTAGTIHTDETYTTSDSEATRESIKAEFESEGNTNVTVSAGPTERTEGDGTVYDFTVTYTTPSTTDTWSGTEAEFNALSAERRTELASYTHTTTDVTTGLAKGEIVYWDTKHREEDYQDTSDADHKIRNDLFYNEDTKTFKIEHNIFGGGYIACHVAGTANVKMEKGLGDKDLLSLDQWKESFHDYANPHFYAFGGGYGAYTTVGSTIVDVNVADYDHDLDADTDEQLARPMNLLGGDDEEEINIGIRNNEYGIAGATVLGVLGGAYAGFVKENTDVTVDGVTFVSRVYGGGFGQLAAYNNLSGLAANPLTAADAYLNTKTREDLGMVDGNTNVHIYGGNIYGDVFGGGAGVEWDDNADHDFTMGEVNGITNVEIAKNAHVFGNVYGGGDVANVRGVIDADADGNRNDRAEYTTNVDITGGYVFANVFGGGSGREASKVQAVTNNTVAVGKIIGNTMVNVMDVKATTEDVEKGYAVTVGDIFRPSIYGNIYGGCAFGQVVKSVLDTDPSYATLKEGNTTVLIEGGNIGNNIFGGGLGMIDEKAAAEKQITSADIAGNTDVTISGGSALWNSRSDSKGNIKTWLNSEIPPAAVAEVRKAILLKDMSAMKERLKGLVNENFFDVDSLKFEQDHNIYGGGNAVCVVKGNANVTLNHALITAPEFISLSNITGICWAASIDNKEFPQYSVFGGGYGPHTLIAGNTNVKMQCGRNGNEVWTEDEARVYNTTNAAGIADGTIARVNTGDDKDESFEYANKEADRESWTNWFRSLLAAWASTSDADKNEKYGGAGDATGIWRFAVSQLAWSPGIANLIQKGVYGGGYAGVVSGNTNVDVSHYSCLRYVYGGGLGSRQYLGKYNTSDFSYLYKRLGEVGGSTNVNISGGIISGETYGGGAGMEPTKLSKDATDLTDFVDMARVKGTTTVRINGSPTVTAEGTKGTVFFGDIFGGGDVANVGEMQKETVPANPSIDGYFTSRVIMHSGTTMGQVFAGGNGRVKALCSGEDANHQFGYQKVGAIYGNTLLEIDGFDAQSSAGNTTDTQGKGITYIFKRVFGGGNNGSVHKVATTSNPKTMHDATGHAYVSVAGGYLAHNVFGGGVGTVGATADENTYSYVDGNTYVKMLGGLAIVDQYWDKPSPLVIDQYGNTLKDAEGNDVLVEQRQWAAINTHDGKKYSAQYDPIKQKLLIDHNVYAGCRNAGYVNGDTHLTMNRSYIRSGLRAGNYDGVASVFFKSNEWKEIYEKIGSPHFCIFGGGYGENTHVMRDTWVDVDINHDKNISGLIDGVELTPDDYKLPAEQRFQGGQSMMDVIGGGYSGDVAGATHVNIANDVYLRRVFGGAFYASCGQTNVRIKSANVDDVFGGGMMGDVSGAVNVEIGLKDGAIDNNQKIFINHDVYGGNDVSGQVEGQITLNLRGGHIYNNVYGAGNGNYLYVNSDKVSKVTPHEDYVFEDNPSLPLVYEVPQREFMINLGDVRDGQKLVNINSWRPLAQYTTLNLGGTSVGNKLLVDGSVFGGGNTATLTRLDGNRPKVNFNIGSHVKIGSMYMGADGEEMFNDKNHFYNDFQTINQLTMSRNIRDLWNTDPAYQSIPTKYLPIDVEKRARVYPLLLDLYFSPVEMSTQANLNWCSDPWSSTAIGASGNAETDLRDATIGTFVCGGNRGNMDVEPWDGITLDYGGNVTKTGQVVNYTFPAGLKITGNIVGGCNNASYIPQGQSYAHEGGYMLGERGGAIETNLKVMCEFDIEDSDDAEAWKTEGRNIYGGCYDSGVTRGDINIDFRSSMLSVNNISNHISEIREKGLAIGNIYGAGYGNKTFVYGNTNITFGKGCENTIDGSGNVTTYGCTANYIYGGGQKGNLVGNSFIHVLNGHLASSAVGGSYSGLMWGSTHVVVGYPKYYTCNKSGKYYLTRADKWNVGQKRTDQTDANKHKDGTEIIKQSVYLMQHDIVSEEVYNMINGYQGATEKVLGDAGALQMDGEDCFSAAHVTTPWVDCFESPTTGDITDDDTAWANIRIKMDEAAYGGGYSLAEAGGEAGAGAATVLKFSEARNINSELSSHDIEALNNGTRGSIGYGGNTTVLVWDNTATDQEVDHVDISSQAWKEVTGLTEGEDIFSRTNYRYVHDPSTGSYTYVGQEGKYFYGTGTDTNNDGVVDDTGRYYKVFTSSSEGGVYGDGHLSFAEGFRTAEVKGYGFAEHKPTSPKVLNTLQRFDVMTIEDCAMVLLGARDYTVGNDISTMPYSLARIGELKMVAKNVTNVSSGNLTDASDGDVKHSRNYLGLSSNIYYVGAVNSNIDFNAKYHDHSGIEDTKSKTYRSYKQNYIDTESGNDSEFQKRNDGTAANMIGISSGYALKVQNVYTNNLGKENLFYGPVIGVVEMNLINVHEDEGGGYVYADNIHHRKAAGGGGSGKPAKTTPSPNPNIDDVPGEIDDDEDFLETSGNFVFPYNEQLHRYIVDDCFPVGFIESKKTTDGKDHATEEIHYWYVTGYNYFYNAHITGYTYDTESSAKSFHSNNTDGLLVLSGIKKGQLVNLQKLTWNTPHVTSTGFLACDLEGDPSTSTGQKGNTPVKYYKPDGSVDTEVPATPTHVEYDHYNLFMSAGIDKTTKRYSNKNTAYWDYLPLKNNISSARTTSPWLTQPIQENDPSLAFMLTDQVDNSGADYYQKFMKEPCLATIVLTAPAVKIVSRTVASEAEAAKINEVAPLVPDSEGRKPGEDGYVETKETVVNGGITTKRIATSEDVNRGLATKVGEVIDNFEFIKSYISLQKLYTVNDGVYTEVPSTTALSDSPGTYYYMGSEGEYHEYTYSPSTLYWYDAATYHAYIPVGGIPANTVITKAQYDELSTQLKARFADNGDGTYKNATAIEGKSGWSSNPKLNGTDKYYVYDARFFCYTVYLTIDYVQGPTYTGNINIHNCALPGEKIKIDRGDFKLDGDLTFTIKDQYWRFGPRVYDNEKDRYTLDPAKYITYKVNTPYAKGHDGKDDTNVLFPEKIDNDEDDSIELPAYYFMNGYGVQYVFSVNGLDDDILFEVNMQKQDKLLVHNYHRMAPRHATGVYTPAEMELYLDRAAERAVSDALEVQNGTMAAGDALPEPRIYMTDATDLKRFEEFIAPVSAPELDRYKKGANMQFFLQNDITVPADYTPHAFNGTLNGDGHTLTFNAKAADSNCLLQSLSEKANIHNLGMMNGVITLGDKLLSGAPTKNEKYHCCFNIANISSPKDFKHVVYRIDGTPVTTYTPDDWRLGKVTYDLNQYYLERRLSKAVTADEGEAMARPMYAPAAPPVYGGTDFEYHQHYVEDIYRNGDYLYARQQSSSNEYLRTNSRPNYGSTTTWHNTSHAIDHARALGYKASPETFLGTYEPLIDEAHVAGTESTATALRNDYIFFGQRIMPTATVDDGFYPHVNAYNTSADNSHNSNSPNRVLRAYGFHGNKTDRTYHFNINAWAQEENLTAIDFTGAHDDLHPWNRGAWDGIYQSPDLTDPAAAYPAVDRYVFYPMVMDMPVPLIGFNRVDGVSRNLLVYTDASEDTAPKSYTAVHSALNYNESYPEANIRGHQIIKRVHVPESPDHATALLHLVDRTQGETFNNDFNCPIPFDVTNRAWYVRRPALYGGGTATEYKRNDAWEGLALPFAVNRVTSWGDKYELTHFYGADDPDHAANDGSDAGSDPDNINNVGHEYWLRGLVDVTTKDGKTNGTFCRPSANSGHNLFFISDALSGNYTYNCTYLHDTYYKYSDDKDEFLHQGIYDASRTYTDYVPQNADVPYIVRFPGERYKEFDLSSEYNKYLLDGENNHSSSWPAPHMWHDLIYNQPQSVTFNWYADNGGRTIESGTPGQPSLAGSYTVKVTDVQSSLFTAASGYKHAATYKALDSSLENPVYGINADGTAFDAEVASVLPFRTYMTTAATPQHAPRYIVIGGGETGIEQPADPQTGEDLAKRLIVYSVNHNIIIESTYQADILIYSASGQLVRAVHVDEGSNLYTGFPAGIYIINGHKIAVR